LNNPLRFVDPDGESAVSFAIKLVLKGGDIGLTAAGIVADAKTVLSSKASLGERLLAGASLASELLPVSARDLAAIGGTVAALSTVLRQPDGGKLRQMIGRFRRLVGGRPGREEFLQFASSLTERAKASGNFVTGKVGQLENATIFKDGDSFLVVDSEGVIRSFVGEAHEGGIHELYFKLLSEGAVD
jgi:hypothetical protein